MAKGFQVTFPNTTPARAANFLQAAVAAELPERLLPSRMNTTVEVYFPGKVTWDEVLEAWEMMLEHFPEGVAGGPVRDGKDQKAG